MLPRGICKIIRQTVLGRTILIFIFSQFLDYHPTNPFRILLNRVLALHLPIYSFIRLLSSFLPSTWLSLLRNSKFLARTQSFSLLPVHYPSSSHNFPFCLLWTPDLTTPILAPLHPTRTPPHLPKSPHLILSFLHLKQLPVIPDRKCPAWSSSA